VASRVGQERGSVSRSTATAAHVLERSKNLAASKAAAGHRPALLILLARLAGARLWAAARRAVVLHPPSGQKRRWTRRTPGASRSAERPRGREASGVRRVFSSFSSLQWATIS